MSLIRHLSIGCASGACAIPGRRALALRPTCISIGLGLGLPAILVLEIGDVPAAALQLKARSRNKLVKRIAATGGTSCHRRITHLLQVFLFETTRPTPVFIDRHDNPPTKKAERKKTGLYLKEPPNKLLPCRPRTTTSLLTPTRLDSNGGDRTDLPGESLVARNPCHLFTRFSGPAPSR